MSESGGRSVYEIYRRLIGFARPYGLQILIGVIAGFAVGSSSFGILRSIPAVTKPIEQKAVVDNRGAASAPKPEMAMNIGLEKIVNDLGSTRAGRWVLAKAHKLGLISEGTNVPSDRLFVLMLCLVPLIVVARALALYVNRYVVRWVSAAVVRDIRNQLFCQLQSQSLRFFGTSDVGQLISRCTNDAMTVEHTLSLTAAEITRAPFEVAATVAFVVLFTLQNKMMGLLVVCIVAVPLCVVPLVLLGKRLRRYTHAALGRVSELVSRMHENFTGIRVVKAFHMEQKEAERFRTMNAGYFRSVTKALRAELIMGPLMEVVGGFLVVVFAALCYTKGISFGEIVSVGMAGVMAYRPIKEVVQINANLQRGAAALDRIFSLLDADTAIREAAAPVKFESFKDRIAFENIRFRYSDDGPLIVDDISFEVRKGSVVALVGETGSGKTTMANLLARFYDPISGRITMDGVDLRDAEIASLRRLIGVVTQETIIFNDTIANNIAYGSDWATREQVIEAARKANAHEFIMAEAAGYDRMAGEKGFVLSGGQRQRIAIARAILRNPPILILDEATSALDTVTERLVQEAISRVMKDRTVFAIAHRLSTIKHADLILVMDRGRVSERGTHEQLMSAGGAYKKLCDMQFGVV